VPQDRTKDYCLMKKLMEAVGATAGPEQLLGKDTNGPMSKEYRPKSDEHILSMVYDDGKTWFTCIAQTNQELWPKLGDGVRKAAYRGGWKPA
jgi:hypothetical protein